MALFEYVARQLRQPSGRVGRLVVARLLNRANVADNTLTLELLDPEPGEHVIEVGFGGGDLLKRLLAVVGDGHIAGVDFSPQMVRLCARRFDEPIRAGRMELRCAAVEDLPYDPESFSKACTVNTIYFWPDPLRPLCELHRVLRPGGRLVVTFGARSTLEKMPATRQGFRLYDPEQVRSLLEEARFTDVRLVPNRTPDETFFCAVGTRRARQASGGDTLTRFV